MKSLILFMSLTVFIITGCATQKGTKEDYFGYTNSPTINESTERTTAYKPKRSAPPVDSTVTPLADAPKDEWINPISQEDSYQDDYQDAAVPNVSSAAYQPYSSPQYVPVIVPWWDNYSGWMGGYYSRPVVAVRYRNWYWGWNSYCDWYSPYYEYHPWYGGYFSSYQPRYYGWNRNYWRPWNHYPIYSYNHTVSTPIKPNTVRTWGTTRGTTNSSGGVRNVNTSNPVSTTPAVRNERGQSSGVTPAQSSNSGTAPTLRTERRNSTTNDQPGSQHPLKRSETTPVIRQERQTKEATPTQQPRTKTPSTVKPAPRQERAAPSQSATPAPQHKSSPTPASSTPSTTPSRGKRNP